MLEEELEQETLMVTAPLRVLEAHSLIISVTLLTHPQPKECGTPCKELTNVDFNMDSLSH